MKIVAVEPLGITKLQFERLQNDFLKKGHEFSFYMDRNENPDILAERIGNSDIVIISNIILSEKIMVKCPNLKMLSVAFTGLDHIDLSYCKLNNIEVYNASGYSTIAVSELTIGLMIDVYRKIAEMDTRTRNLETRSNFLGKELHGKTVGVVGTGTIGTQTIKLLLAFGCNVLAYNRTQYDSITTLGARYVTLNELLKLSDIITIHVPSTPDTYHMINHEKLKLMKSDSILINTARGNVVDNEALAEALKDSKIAGAGIDVYETEPPLPLNYPLLSAPNVILTPHIAYATKEAFKIRAEIVIEKVWKWVENYTQ